MVRDMSLGAAVGALYRFDGAACRRRWCRASHRQRPGVQPGRPDALPVRLAPERAEDLGFDLAPTARCEPRGLRRHGRAPRPPDGAAVDVDGCYWTCATDAGALLRFTPQGGSTAR
jgi:hypothetical protein